MSLTMNNFIGYDTDGTAWVTVRYTVEVQVMADNKEHALLFAGLALPDHCEQLADSGEVVEL